MEWSIKKVRKLFDDKLVGNDYMKEIVCKTVLLLPPELIINVCKNIWFISSPEDAWAFTFRGSEIKHRSLIFLSEELLQQPENQINYTILHEIGHVLHNHRNSIGYEQTKSEVKFQEKEADLFANRYLNKFK